MIDCTAASVTFEETLKKGIHMTRQLIATVVVIGLMSSAQAAQAKGKKKMPKPVRAGAKPFVYKTVGEQELTLYVTTPEDHQSTEKRAAIVFFHGGGWVGGAPGQFTEHSKHLAARGMVTVQAQYRLLDREKPDTPEVCIQDAKSAMRWVRSHAEELGIDPDRIAAGGGSAGGHLAAAVTLLDGVNDPLDDLSISPKANAMVLFNPVYNNGSGKEGWGQKRVGDRFKEFSPAHNIREGAPPNLVFLGTNDKLIPVATAEKFRADMQNVGSRSELVLFEGEGHGFFNYGKKGGEPYRKTIVAMDKFLVSLGYLASTPH